MYAHKHYSSQHNIWLQAQLLALPHKSLVKRHKFLLPFTSCICQAYATFVGHNGYALAVLRLFVVLWLSHLYALVNLWCCTSSLISPYSRGTFSYSAMIL